MCGNPDLTILIVLCYLSSYQSSYFLFLLSRPEDSWLVKWHYLSINKININKLKERADGITHDELKLICFTCTKVYHYGGKNESQCLSTSKNMWSYFTFIELLFKNLFTVIDFFIFIFFKNYCLEQNITLLGLNLQPSKYK